MGRHAYKNVNKEFVKIIVELEKDIYDKLVDIRCDYFDSRSIKEIVNSALIKYLSL